MSANEIHVDDIGTAFDATITESDAAVNVSGVTVKELLFQKPDGTKVTQSAIFKTDGTDGIIRYVTVDGDLDVAGQWKIQVHIRLAGGEWHSDQHRFTVYQNL